MKPIATESDFARAYVLIQKIDEPQYEGTTLREDAAHVIAQALAEERAPYVENLTATQERCTELLEEARAARRDTAAIRRQYDAMLGVLEAEQRYDELSQPADVVWQTADGCAGCDSEGRCRRDGCSTCCFCQRRLTLADSDDVCRCEGVAIPRSGPLPHQPGCPYARRTDPIYAKERGLTCNPEGSWPRTNLPPPSGSR